ncbi:MAG: carboxypeptidase-like regulatory domain-containing protein [Alphaproteobacteria bacterium]|nr:carboxypeptidase-like regulatory domain-containing protein [Alphaproteobacteria bacterium]
MKKILVAILTIFTLSSPSWAEPLPFYGAIYDKNDKTPIVGAYVIYTVPNKIMEQYEETDIDGKFTIKDINSVKNGEIKISMMGYSEQKINISKINTTSTKPYSIYLEPYMDEIDEVIIAGTSCTKRYANDFNATHMTQTKKSDEPQPTDCQPLNCKDGYSLNILSEGHSIKVYENPNGKVFYSLDKGKLKSKYKAQCVRDCPCGKESKKNENSIKEQSNICTPWNSIANFDKSCDTLPSNAESAERACDATGQEYCKINSCEGGKHGDYSLYELLYKGTAHNRCEKRDGECAPAKRIKNAKSYKYYQDPNDNSKVFCGVNECQDHAIRSDDNKTCTVNSCTQLEETKLKIQGATQTAKIVTARGKAVCIPTECKAPKYELHADDDAPENNKCVNLVGQDCDKITAGYESHADTTAGGVYGYDSDNDKLFCYPVKCTQNYTLNRKTKKCVANKCPCGQKQVGNDCVDWTADDKICTETKAGAETAELACDAKGKEYCKINSCIGEKAHKNFSVYELIKPNTSNNKCVSRVGEKCTPTNPIDHASTYKYYEDTEDQTKVFCGVDQCDQYYTPSDEKLSCTAITNCSDRDIKNLNKKGATTTMMLEGKCIPTACDEPRYKLENEGTANAQCVDQVGKECSNHNDRYASSAVYKYNNNKLTCVPTGCISGYRLDTQTKKCVVNNCPCGKKEVDNECVEWEAADKVCAVKPVGAENAERACDGNQEYCKIISCIGSKHGNYSLYELISPNTSNNKCVSRVGQDCRPEAEHAAAGELRESTEENKLFCAVTECEGSYVPSDDGKKCVVNGPFTIIGTVIEKAKGKSTPLSGATVAYEPDQVSTTYYHTTTDGKGNFSLEIPSAGNIVISLVGYTAQKLYIDKTTTLKNIKLDPDSNTLYTATTMDCSSKSLEKLHATKGKVANDQCQPTECIKPRYELNVIVNTDEHYTATCEDLDKKDCYNADEYFDVNALTYIYEYDAKQDKLNCVPVDCMAGYTLSKKTKKCEVSKCPCGQDESNNECVDWEDMGATQCAKLPAGAESAERACNGGQEYCKIISCIGSEHGDYSLYELINPDSPSNKCKSRVDQKCRPQADHAKDGKLRESAEGNKLFCAITECEGSYVPSDDGTTCEKSGCTEGDSDAMKNANAKKWKWDNKKNQCIPTKCECGYGDRNGKPIDNKCDVKWSWDDTTPPTDTKQECTIKNAKEAYMDCDASGKAYCRVHKCDEDNGYNIAGNQCVADACKPDDYSNSIYVKRVGGECKIQECKTGYQVNKKTNKCDALENVLSKKESEERIKELQANEDALKENEQKLENKLLGAAGIAGAGIGGQMLLTGIAQLRADAKAESDMTAYLATFKCKYGNKMVDSGNKEIELPGANDQKYSEMYRKYKELASDLKLRKASLGMKPGIESEEILDISNLYSNGNIGGADGAYTSLADALSGDKDAQNEWDDQKEKASNIAIVGGVLAGAAVISTAVGDHIVNKDAPKNQAKEINENYDEMRGTY